MANFDPLQNQHPNRWPRNLSQVGIDIPESRPHFKQEAHLLQEKPRDALCYQMRPMFH